MKSSSQTNATKTPTPTPPSKPPLPKVEKEPPVSSQYDALNTSPIPPASQPHTQQPQKSIPIAALNSTIVSQISSRAGARPGRPPTDLPANYKPVARRVTLAIVALPIAIVTSWVLYQRRKFSIYLQCLDSYIDRADIADGLQVVLGEERKHLVRPGMVMVEESPPMKQRGRDVNEKDI
jgi:hypothetical protein